MQKTRFSAVVSTFIYCFIFWLLLTWSLDAQELIAGAVVSLAAALFSARFFIHNKAFWMLRPDKLANMVAYLFVFFGELWRANVDVAKRCFGGCRNVYPGIVKVPVDIKADYGQAMLANCITLTPGTITLDIAEEEDGRDYFYIHCIDVRDFEDKELFYVSHDGKNKPLPLHKDRAKAGDSIKGTMEKWMRRIWE